VLDAHMSLITRNSVTTLKKIIFAASKSYLSRSSTISNSWED